MGQQKPLSQLAIPNILVTRRIRFRRIHRWGGGCAGWRAARCEVMSRRQSVLRVSLADVSAQPPFRLLVRPYDCGGCMVAGRVPLSRTNPSGYDLPPPAVVLNELDQYWAVTDVGRGTLVGFICAGATARVPGLDADPMSAGRDVLTVGGCCPARRRLRYRHPESSCGIPCDPGQLPGWVAARSGPEKAGSQRDRR